MNLSTSVTTNAACMDSLILGLMYS